MKPLKLLKLIPEYIAFLRKRAVSPPQYPVPPPPSRKNPPPWERDYPPTIGKRPKPNDPRENLIFDPALKHYGRAFRRGDPELPETAMRLWQGARRRAMHHLLEIVASTKWAEQLILRGSAALKAVLGDAAREPGDIDWVVQPESLRMDEPAAAELLSGIIAAVKHSPRAGAVEFDIDAIARTDIWTYERAPGHRLAFPWAFQDLPPGVVQMDFVFGETLFTPAQSLAVGLCELPPVTLSAASDEESLAWKLLWLYSDSYPQGKDLYDAMLLAERVPLRGEVLYQVIAKTEDCRPDWIPSLFPFRGHDRELDWSSMPRGLTASEEEKTDMGLRLAATIRPAVEECLRLAKAAPIRSSPRTPAASA